MMRPRFPSLNLGTPFQRGFAVVFPIYAAQMTLFDTTSLETSWHVSDSHTRKKMVVSNRGPHGPTISLMNRGDSPILLMPDDLIAGKCALTCPILVPKTNIAIRVPSLCYTRMSHVLGGQVVPPANAIGWAAIVQKSLQMSLFGSSGACRKGGYRRLAIHTLGTTAINVQAFVNSIHCLPWQRIRPVGIGQAWIAALDRIQAEVLFFERKLVYLRSQTL